jgi:hypothetical protein
MLKCGGSDSRRNARVIDRAYRAYDFFCGQIANQSQLSRQAERAAERAADLRRNANRDAVFARDENGFGQFAVMELQQVPDCPVG